MLFLTQIWKEAGALPHDGPPDRVSHSTDIFAQLGDLYLYFLLCGGRWIL